jgi:hypothetical protein
VTALATIATRAAEQNLPFLLAGGHAVIAHGHRRTTVDLDLIVRRSDLENWRKLLLGLAYTLYRENPAFAQFNAPNEMSQPLDLMLVTDETFDRFLVEAVPTSAESVTTRTVCLQHLLALKCAAIKHGHAGRIFKDADDVIRLVLENRIDLNADKYRELFLKYGTPEFYEKVQRACGQI